MSTKERPTPESDIETLFRNVHTAGGVEQWEVVRADFARSLEKQRDELKELLGEAKAWLPTDSTARLCQVNSAAPLIARIDALLTRNNDKKEDK